MENIEYIAITRPNGAVVLVKSKIHSAIEDPLTLHEEIINELYHQQKPAVRSETIDMIDRLMKAIIKLHPNLAMDSPMEYELYMSYHNLKSQLEQQEEEKKDELCPRCGATQIDVPDNPRWFNNCNSCKLTWK